MKKEIIALIFGVFMIKMGYEIISTGYLSFRGAHLYYGDRTKFVGPLFVAIGSVSILYSIVVYFITKRKNTDKALRK